jgi:hypothetical protein
MSCRNRALALRAGVRTLQRETFRSAGPGHRIIYFVAGLPGRTGATLTWARNGRHTRAHPDPLEVAKEPGESATQFQARLVAMAKHQRAACIVIYGLDVIARGERGSDA